MSRAARTPLAALALLAGLAGCAQPGAPRGGPVDNKAPTVAQIVPETGAVNVNARRVIFRLDETVTDRPQGVTSINRLFLVSPSDGDPSVDWDRDVFTVRPRRGFRPNTVYTITMLPGAVDVQGNVMKEGATAIFSTGPTIPNTTLAGIVFDWPAGRPAARPYMEAISLPDSTVYVTIGDSTGRFVFQHLPPGRYAVRGTVDQNNNRARDARELYDSLEVALGDSFRVELLAFVHDTIGPRINELTVRDSVTLRVTLDKPLDPRQAITPALFALRAADSSVVPIAGASSSVAFDSLERVRSRTRADSAARADTSARGRADTTRRATPGVTDAGVAGRRVAAAPPGRNPSGVQPSTQRDSATTDSAAAPKPSRPSPISEVVITLGEPLKPASNYRLRANNLRGLLGAERTSDRAFTTPKPPPPPAADSGRTRSPADSAGARRPPATPPATAPAARPPTPPVRPPRGA